MSIEYKAVACAKCEGQVRRGEKIGDQVFWHVYLYRNGLERRGIGWLTQGEIGTKYQGRIKKTPSSTTCPPCGAAFLGYDSVGSYREHFVAKEVKTEGHDEFIQSIDQFNARNKQHPF